MSNSDPALPKLIYGTAWKKERTAALVKQAIELGFRGIDTACQPKHYNEQGVGEGLVAACLNQGIDRQAIYLQSKFTPLNGQDPLQVPYDPHVKLEEQVAQSFMVSLKNLQTSYLDCLILHSPLANQQQTTDVWLAMEKIFNHGGVKRLGLSNCYDMQTLEDLYRTVEIKPAVIQNRFYRDSGFDRNIREFCRQQRITYQSFWTLTANPSLLADPQIKNLSLKYQRTPAQVLFRYLTQIDIVPLTGTTSTAHMLEDLAIFSFQLSSDECAGIDNLL